MTSNVDAPKIYRPNVGIMLIKDGGLIWVGERLDFPGSWQMPQGGIEPNEDIETAFFRELEEEIGTARAEILGIMPEKLRYDFPEGKKQKLYGGLYDGQEQTWIAARFIGHDAEINIHSHNPSEFQAWKWVSIDVLLDTIVPFKRGVYEKVVAAFVDFLK